MTRTSRTTRARSGSWRAAPRCCGRSRSASSPRTSGPGSAAMIRALTISVPRERTRRTRPSAKGDRFDLRRTLRRSLRTQGEPFDRAWRARTTRNRPLVLILDISGSMAPYSRALMQFAYAAMAAGRRVETFVFGTRLTRVTRTLRTKDPDRALARDRRGRSRTGKAARASARALKTLLDGWSQRAALARRRRRAVLRRARARRPRAAARRRWPDRGGSRTAWCG